MNVHFNMSLAGLRRRLEAVAMILAIVVYLVIFIIAAAFFAGAAAAEYGPQLTSVVIFLVVLTIVGVTYMGNWNAHQ